MILNNVRLFFVILTFGVVASCSGIQENMDCRALKTGRFEYRGGYGDRVFSIERNDSIQLEYDPLTKQGARLAIKWTGPCEYKLSLIALTFNGQDIHVDRPEYTSVRTSIKRIAKNYYISESIDNRGGTRVDTILMAK